MARGRHNIYAATTFTFPLPASSPADLMPTQISSNTSKIVWWHLAFRNLTGHWWKQTSGTRTRCSCHSSILHGTFMMCITSNTQRTHLQSQSRSSPALRRRMNAEQIAGASAGATRSIGILPADCYYAAKEQHFQRATCQPPTYRVSILGSHAASVTTKWMRRTLQISTKQKESYWVRM